MNMESSTWIKRSIISMAVASALLSNVVIAEENKDVDTTIITGEKPATLDINIDQDTLDKMQANDLEDVFNEETEVAVGGGLGVAQKIYVRGLEDTMLNVSIDGATQSGYLFHHQGRISIDPALLKKVEVQAGTGDATSGPGALGGAIKFITKDPEDLLQAEERFGALLQGSYATNNNGYKANLSVYGTLNDNWSAMANVIQTAADNYEDAEGNEATESDFDQQVGFAKIVGKFSNNQKLSLSYDRRVDDGDKLNRAQWAYDSVKNQVIPQEALRETSTLKYAINPSDNKWLALETSAYITENELVQTSELYGRYEGGVKSTGFDIHNKSVLSDHSFVYGVDHRNDTAYGNGESYSNEEEAQVSGVYLQANIQLADAWLLSTGARYDAYKLTDDQNQSLDSQGFSPNASLIFTPLDELKLNLGYAQAIRGAQVKETYLLGSQTNSADREEETAKSIEFGIDYQFDNLSLSAKVFDTTIEDVAGILSLSEDGGSSKVMGNIGELTTQGFTVGANYNWKALRTSLSYNHSDAELNGEKLTDDTTSLGTSVGDKINASIIYQVTSSLELGWNASFVRDLTDVEDGNEKAGYGVQDIYAQWLPLHNDSLKVTFAINNALNKQYKDHATYDQYADSTWVQGISEPGRDFRLNVAWAL